MNSNETHAVTGAFGYSGKYIAEKLIERGHRVITLTNSPDRPNPFAGKVAAHPFNFDNPEKLAESLRGVRVLYNTYWIRFNHALFKHASAVRNTLALFEAAKKAGVERVVHVSITNPSLNSPLEYFRGKAELEQALIASGLPHSILRPAVIFGGEDILINNIAWMLRRLPVFGIFGDGNYRLQPIHVDDMAQLAVDEGTRDGNCTINAIGPETFAYKELVRAIAKILGPHRLIVSVPNRVGYIAGCALGALVDDVIITREEIEGLVAGLLHVDAPPAGRVPLTEWARQHADTLGRHYASELARRKDRARAYIQRAHQ